MRIVAGSARGRRLQPFRQPGVRPTPDRVREALFSIIQGYFPSGLAGRQVVDLFAGSGALGIEALSRGAASAVFVDSAGQASKLQRSNLVLCDLAARGEVVTETVESFLGRARTRPAACGGPFDLVFADPPYGDGGHADLLPRLAGACTAPGAIIVVEHESREEAPEPGELLCLDRRTYGRTSLTFYSPGPDSRA